MKKIITISEKEFKEKIIGESISKVNFVVDRVIEAMVIIYMFFYIGVSISTNTRLQSIVSGIISLFTMFNIFVLIMVKKALRRYLIKQSMEEKIK